MNYKRMIKKLAQFYGSDGHPAYNDTPLTKFTLSVEFKQMVSLFVDFSQTSENTFRSLVSTTHLVIELWEPASSIY